MKEITFSGSGTWTPEQMRAVTEAILGSPYQAAWDAARANAAEAILACYQEATANPKENP